MQINYIYSYSYSHFNMLGIEMFDRPYIFILCIYALSDFAFIFTRVTKFLFLIRCFSL